MGCKIINILEKKKFDKVIESQCGLDNLNAKHKKIINSLCKHKNGDIINGNSFLKELDFIGVINLRQE